eukprot:TRINITY_DN11319_c0_g1_i1.p1 TRINITY_DN11319_c0_g1~~TRINITY_DN11319_c0_g1_i1.p1  ORF type:complete len:712 (+),score=142.12 TRINITY_DN11319_c0_g1_i1:202-2337(+)
MDEYLVAQGLESLIDGLRSLGCEEISDLYGLEADEISETLTELKALGCKPFKVVKLRKLLQAGASTTDPTQDASIPSSKVSEPVDKVSAPADTSGPLSSNGDSKKLCSQGHPTVLVSNPSDLVYDVESDVFIVFCDICGADMEPLRPHYHCRECQFDQCLECKSFGTDDDAELYRYSQSLRVALAKVGTRTGVVMQLRQDAVTVDGRRLTESALLVDVMKDEDDGKVILSGAAINEGEVDETTFDIEYTQAQYDDANPLILSLTSSESSHLGCGKCGGLMARSKGIGGTHCDLCHRPIFIDSHCFTCTWPECNYDCCSFCSVGVPTKGKLYEAWLRSSGLMEQAADGLQSAFRILDKDNSGDISFSEIYFFIQKSQVDVPASKLRSLFDAIDTDRSDSIDPDEFGRLGEVMIREQDEQVADAVSILAAAEWYESLLQHRNAEPGKGDAQRAEVLVHTGDCIPNRAKCNSADCKRILLFLNRTITEDMIRAAGAVLFEQVAQALNQVGFTLSEANFPLIILGRYRAASHAWAHARRTQSFGKLVQEPEIHVLPRAILLACMRAVAEETITMLLDAVKPVSDSPASRVGNSQVSRVNNSQASKKRDTKPSRLDREIREAAFDTALGRDEYRQDDDDDGETEEDGFGDESGYWDEDDEDDEDDAVGTALAIAAAAAADKKARRKATAKFAKKAAFKALGVGVKIGLNLLGVDFF